MRLVRYSLMILRSLVVSFALCAPAAACNVDLEIWGYTPTTEDDPGAVVVRNEDNNGAARKRIILRWNEYTGDVILGCDELTKVSVFYDAEGGEAITFTDGEKEFPHPGGEGNMDLWVQGDAGSEAKRDVELSLAREGEDPDDSVTFTVLWVEVSWKRLAEDSVANDNNDNSERPDYHTLTGTYNLGLIDDNDGFRGWFYEITGTVQPSNFSDNVFWNQDCQRRPYEDNGFFETDRDFSSPFPPGNDGPLDTWQDKDPQSGGSGGKVYYLDGPGLFRNSSKPKDTIRRLRVNFKAAALYTGHGYTNQRCSEIWTHYVRISMKKTDDPPGNTWVDPEDVANDQEAESGSFTKISWDLNSPTVTSIAPNSGTNDGTVSITDLVGTSFVRGATVKLTKNGQSPIEAIEGLTTYVDVTKITCTFDLTGKATGQWNVVVINPFGDEEDPSTGGMNLFTVNAP